MKLYLSSALIQIFDDLLVLVGLYILRLRPVLGLLIKSHLFRGDAHPLVNRFPKAEFARFKTLVKAKAYIEENGVMDYECNIKQTAVDKTPKEAYYAVANGRKQGIHEYY